MNLTIKDYVNMRINKRMTDGDILEHLGYSRNSIRLLVAWKHENSVHQGKSLMRYYDAEKFLKWLAKHGVKSTAEHFQVGINTVYRWEKKLRRNI